MRESDEAEGRRRRDGERERKRKIVSWPEGSRGGHYERIRGREKERERYRRLILFPRKLSRYVSQKFSDNDPVVLRDRSWQSRTADIRAIVPFAKSILLRAREYPVFVALYFVSLFVVGRNRSADWFYWRFSRGAKPILICARDFTRLNRVGVVLDPTEQCTESVNDPACSISRNREIARELLPDARRINWRINEVYRSVNKSWLFCIIIIWECSFY